MDVRPVYRRILLKLSGEALMGEGAYGIDRNTLERIVTEIAEVVRMGVETGIVIGGGNIFRGVALGAAGMDRATADYMGMLATVMNALALQDAFRHRKRCTVSGCCMALFHGWFFYTVRQNLRSNPSTNHWFRKNR